MKMATLLNNLECNISRKLDTFSDDERIEYRDKNASAIAEHSAAKILIT